MNKNNYSQGESYFKDNIYSFYLDKKRMPSYTEMMKIFGFKSKNAVYKVVKKLCDTGIIEKDSSGKLIPNQSISDFPLLGFVTAGLPASVDQAPKEVLNLDSFLINKRGQTFFLEVDGDSMIDAHIESGDMVLVEKTSTAKDGDIVIAKIDGEWTMKFLRKKGTKLWLEPANKKYLPLHPTYELEVGAVVRAVIRKY